MNRRPPHHLGYSPHSPYGELGFSFKKTLQRIKKEAESKAKKVASSPRGKSTRSWLSKMTTKARASIPKTVTSSPRAKSTSSWLSKMTTKAKASVPKTVTSKAKQPFIPAPSWMPKSLQKQINAKQLEAKKAAAKKAVSKKAPAGYKYVMVEKKGPFGVKLKVPKLVKITPKPTPSKPKTVVEVRAGPRSSAPKRVTPRGPTGPRGPAGPRGYPGRTGPTGPRGPPGQSIASTERWKHKLEKDRLMAAYRNQQRLGQERARLHQAQVLEMKKRNAILTQRISEQEQMAKERMDNATVYNQWKSLKDAAQETIFPNLGGIDIEDEYVASSVSVLPWLVLGIALITREG